MTSPRGTMSGIGQTTETKIQKPKFRNQNSESGVPLPNSWVGLRQRPACYLRANSREPKPKSEEDPYKLLTQFERSPKVKLPKGRSRWGLQMLYPKREQKIKWRRVECTWMVLYFYLRRGVLPGCQLRLQRGVAANPYRLALLYVCEASKQATEAEVAVISA